MSNITQNGFYKLSDLISLPFSKGVLEGGGITINIAENLVVCIFDDLNQDIDIQLGEKSILEMYGFQDGSDVGHCKTLKINVLQCHTDSKLKLRYLLNSKDNKKVKSKIYSKLEADGVKSDIKIISIVGDDGFIDLDGIIEITKSVKKVECNLVEENIFLGSSGKAKGIPTLLVASDDVKASHSCKMERISDEQLFYIRSRGIEKENAVSMMIEAKVKSLFSCLSMHNKDFYEELVNSILNKINSEE